jgi:hypothetical protein
MATFVFCTRKIQDEDEDEMEQKIVISNKLLFLAFLGIKPRVLCTAGRRSTT